MQPASENNQHSARILWFTEIEKNDVALVGGKNASLGEMVQHLSGKGIRVPNGFAITSRAYWEFIDHNNLREVIAGIAKEINVDDVDALARYGEQIREAIMAGAMPPELAAEITTAYEKLCSDYRMDSVDVAVRSSATAEDLPDASFAGQQETYLNVRGAYDVVESTKRCFASLFTNRAISYRADHGFDHLSHALSVGVQKMVRADLASSGVMFTIDPESGFDGSVIINGSWGLGEMVVQGKVQPDEFQVFKKTLLEGVRLGEEGCKPTFTYRPIIEKKLGHKVGKMVYSGDGAIRGHGSVKEVMTSPQEVEQYILTDDEILQLGYWACVIGEHYGAPMDIEWAKDGETGELFIVQARPETVQSQKNHRILEEMVLDETGDVLTRGIAVGNNIGTGTVRMMNDVSSMDLFQEGDVLVTEITDPDWEPIMKKAAGIITNSGGRTSHAAIVSREMGIPAIVGTGNATQVLATGTDVTVCCAEGDEGVVYAGQLKYHTETTDLENIPETETQIMMIVADPARAYHFGQIPNQGVGLARLELIILNSIKIHPLALLHFDSLTDTAVQAEIAHLTRGYANKAEYFVAKLAEGIAKIAASFYPHDVIVRMSDFKSNEYAGLLGGRQFEPHEENPMIGWRGASRYYSEQYEPAFALECAALARVRNEMGLTNVKAMIPFCRTPEEGQRVVDTMAKYGATRGENGLEIYVMCEVPSNVLLAKEFSEVFDGFSIGSNDLTQLTLGLDRDSGLVAHLYDERNEAVKKMIRQVIQVAKETGTKIGICGQGPSDFPDFAEFLVECGIDSIALTPDRVVATTFLVADIEKKQG